MFNCGGETRFSQDSQVYKARSYDLSVNLGRECAKRNIKVFIETSTGMVYKPESTPRTETDKLKPWTKLAKSKCEAEEALAKNDGLNLIVLRLAHIYGDYNKGSLATALCIARVYQDLESKMEFLYDADLKQNTVHVSDAARACWHAAVWYAGLQLPKPRRPAPIFNIVDHSKFSMSHHQDSLC